MLHDYNQIWILLTDYNKSFQYQISWKYVLWEKSCSMRTDTTKLVDTFRNNADASYTVVISESLLCAASSVIGYGAIDTDRCTRTYP